LLGTALPLKRDSLSIEGSRYRNRSVILIFCAFSAELEPIRKFVHTQKALGINGLKGCYGRIGNTQIALAASGIGMRRAAENAPRVFGEVHNIDLVILTGVAGALADNLEICDVVLADRLMVREDDSAQPVRTLKVPQHQLGLVSVALETAGINYSRGGILTVKYPLGTEAEKRSSGRNTGAIAVDMETAVIALEAAARGIPFVAMRTIMDTVEHDLAGAGLADENGKVRALKAAATLAKNPAMVPGVIRLVRNLRKASDAMAVAVDVVARHLGELNE
jgi:adenosylhomocysteine nucleosidase